MDTFLHYSEHVLLRGFPPTSCAVFASPVISVYEPPPPLILTTYRNSESRGLLRKQIHIPYGLSRFCGVCLPHSHGVDIVAASPTTVLPVVRACMAKKQQKSIIRFLCS